MNGHHDMGGACNMRKLMMRKSVILRTHEKLETSLRAGTIFHASFFIGKVLFAFKQVFTLLI